MVVHMEGDGKASMLSVYLSLRVFGTVIYIYMHLLSVYLQVATISTDTKVSERGKGTYLSLHVFRTEALAYWNIDINMVLLRGYAPE